MKDSAAKHLAELQYEQRKTAGLLRTSDGRLGELCTHACKPPRKARATWRCPKCHRRPIPERGPRGARVNPYRDGRGRKTELARELRTEHDTPAPQVAA